MNSIIKIKAAGKIDAGSLVTIINGKAYKTNPEYIEKPVSKFSYWFRQHILRKRPLLIPNPEYIGPSNGQAVMGSNWDGNILEPEECLVVMSGSVLVK